MPSSTPSTRPTSTSPLTVPRTAKMAAGRAEDPFRDGMRLAHQARTVAVEEEQREQREHQDSEACRHFDSKRARHAQNADRLGATEQCARRARLREVRA